jgi:uncharacterized SAM-binding protein YcdF (DUF218 family)
MVVVVLGNRLRRAGIHPTLRRRMDAGLELLEADETRPLVVTGGQSNPSIPLTEASVMRDYALRQGVDRARIHLEHAAQDTIGNAFFTRQIVDVLGADRVTAVSSTSHLPRVRFVFDQCFGDGYELTVTDGESADAAESVDPEARRRERKKHRRNQEFFEPVKRGDLDAVRHRLATAHDYYNWLTETVAPRSTAD